jgi:hypothetical protein
LLGLLASAGFLTFIGDPAAFGFAIVILLSLVVLNMGIAPLKKMGCSDYLVVLNHQVDRTLTFFVFSFLVVILYLRVLLFSLGFVLAYILFSFCHAKKA